MLGAALTLGNVALHANELDTREGIVYVRNVLLTKLATIHGDRLGFGNRYPPAGYLFPDSANLIYVWSDDFRERVPGPVQSRFDRAKVALGDLSDFFVGLALELAENENVPMVLG